MKIAIDLTPLQGPHRMRGIGATIINFINNISAEDKKKNKFVFYFYEDKESPLELLVLKNLDYSTATRPSISPQKPSRLPWKLGWPMRAIKQILKLTDFYFGDDRLKQTGKVDAFLQFEQDKPLPKGRSRKIFMVHDIIPYILKSSYLIDYSTARRKGFSRKSSMNHHVHRWLYLHRLKVNLNRASLVLSNSEATKNDILKYTSATAKKIVVTHLGVDEPNSEKTDEVNHHHYIATSWAYLKRPYKLERPYLLFVGGVDPRRRLDELITAYNHLRARGQKIELVLVGDVLQGPDNIPTKSTRLALENSSYKEGIVYMGFVNEEQKADLYKNALAFVYPSVYEGFGLPILEALSAGCPAICYDIPAIREVVGNKPLYMVSYKDIVGHTMKLLASNKRPTQEISNYTWVKTSTQILREANAR